MRGKLTIGELSRRTGVSVKTLRFYSDEGLLPPVGRSRSGYRLFTEEDAVRLDLIRALREAGVGLGEIGQVLRREASLERVLELHLGAVEAHIAGLQRIASALRSAIRSGSTEEHVRRIIMVTRASVEERRKVMTAFYEKVASGLPVDPKWLEGMIEASTAPALASLGPQALAAWTEICGLLDDPSFVACRRVSAADLFVPRFRGPKDAFLGAQTDALTATNEARSRGLSPASAEAGLIVERLTSAIADASGGDDRAAVGSRLRMKYDPRGARFWELVAVMRGDEEPFAFDEWRWLGEALVHHARVPKDELQ